MHRSLLLLQCPIEHLQVCLGTAVDDTVLVAVHYLLILFSHELQNEVLPPRQLWELPVADTVER
jgi:hypothetical protein